MLTVADLLRASQRGAGQTVEGPLEHLTACHRRIEQRLETLRRAGEMFAQDPAQALEAIDKALAFFDTNGVRHTQDEEGSLFPRLAPKLSQAMLELINSLEREHQTATALHGELHAAVERLRSASGAHGEPLAAFADCVARLMALYGRHIEVEDGIVAEQARRHLSGAEWAAIAAEMKLRRAEADAV